MGKKFKNSDEIVRALKKQKWQIKGIGKHLNFVHPLYKGKLPIPKKHNYVSDDVEAKVIQAMREVERKMKESN